MLEGEIGLGIGTLNRNLLLVSGSTSVSTMALQKVTPFRQYSQTCAEQSYNVAVATVNPTIRYKLRPVSSLVAVAIGFAVGIVS